MAMDVGGAKGGVKSDINVTPLVDVMLVLLIIMMLIAPLLQKGVDLTPPVARNTAEKPDTADQTTVYVDANSRLYINAIEKTELCPSFVVRPHLLQGKSEREIARITGLSRNTVRRYLRDEAAARFERLAEHIEARDAGTPGCGGHERRENPHRGAFARTIRTNEAVHRTLRNGEREIVDGGESAERLRQCLLCHPSNRQHQKRRGARPLS